MEHKNLFRRQFILSTNSKFNFDGWINVKLNEASYLSVHPDLGVTQSSFGTIHLSLLGFFVNPFEPMKSNQEILDELVQGALVFNDVLEKSNKLGGRWIIIYNDSNSLNIFHDPGGQRQVYYYQNTEYILCGSDPAIINHFVKLEKDTTLALKDFVNSSNFETNENSWIGSKTMFIGVMHLMPNHYLQFNELKSLRFWPNKPLDNIDLDKVVDLAAEILKGSLDAINNRHKLVLAVTAGWDSRILLSASKDIHKDVIYFVSVNGDQTEKLPDVLIPLKLFNQLDIPFYVQNCETELETEFKKIFKNNVTMARTNLPKSKYIYKYHLEFDGMVSINGGLSEIARTCIRPKLPMKVTGANLSKLFCMKYDGISYVETQLDEWINEISSLCKDNKLNIFDMLYWEQRMGNWGAQYPAEEDIAIDQFCPFNNRLLLATMLSVDEKYRRYPNYTLHYKIMEKLWPETLSQPLGKYSFNVNTRNRIKYYIRRITGVY